MAIKRKPFQGVWNIIRFNWHFYLLAFIVCFSVLYFNHYFAGQFQFLSLWMSVITMFTISTSFLISFYIYDLSNLYDLSWITDADNKKILNIHAGFDETSDLIKSKFPNSDLTICDFYNPKQHTELSVKRARKAYPPMENTIQVSTEKLPFQDNSFDISFAILAAHEIRNSEERVMFFKELNRVTKPSGQILITEHLRDLNNFLAYNIGFFHFHSHSKWSKTFEKANLKVENEVKITPFISTFVLSKNGNTH